MKKLISLITILSIGSAFGMDWAKKQANKASEKVYRAADTLAGEEAGDQIRAFGQQEFDLNGNPTFARRVRGTGRQARQTLAQYQTDQAEKRKRAQQEAEQRRLQAEGRGAVARSREAREKISKKYNLGNSQGSSHSRGTQGREHVVPNPSSDISNFPDVPFQRLQKKEAKKGMLWSALGFLGGCISTIWGARNLLYGNDHFKRDLTITTAGLGLTGYSGYRFAVNFQKLKS